LVNESIREVKLDKNHATLVVWDSVGDEYSIEACIAGGIYTLFLKPSKDNLVNKDNCSCNVVDIIRAYGFNILPSIASNNITPNILLTEIDKIGKQETIDQILDSYKQS